VSARRLVFPRPSSVPAWAQRLAAGLALVGLGSTLLAMGPERPQRAAAQLVSETERATTRLSVGKDRLVENVRVLGASLAGSVEGRLEGWSERVEEYRKHRQKSHDAEDPDKRTEGFRTGPVRSS
jgi:hypothetical protein